MEHPGGVVLHLRLLEVKVLGLVVSYTHLHALAVGALGAGVLVGGPRAEKGKIKILPDRTFLDLQNQPFDKV